MLENQTGEYYFKQMKCSQKMKFKRNFIEYQKRTYHKSFDSIMYQQFKKLREEGIRKNFSLCSYMIFRSLLLDKARVYNSILFTESENKEIQKELLQIEGILL